MKQKIYITGAILLLLGLAGWMAFDLLIKDSPPEKTTFDYGLKTIREADSVPHYTEIIPIQPAVREIRAIASDADGKIYVAGKGGVEIFNPRGKTLNRFTIPGWATCLTVIPDGTLAIGMESHLELWSPDGIQISVWPQRDSLSLITSVAANTGFIYLADAGNKVVLQYDRSGNFLSKIGEKDPHRKIPGFVIPSPYFDLGISPAGDLWVVNPGRHKLELYHPDGSLKKQWGETSLTTEGFSGCCNPSHIAFLRDGSFVTSEKGIERVKIYSPAGTFEKLAVGPESFDEGTRGLDLAVGIEGRIFVLDPVRNQVRVFLPNETH